MATITKNNLLFSNIPESEPLSPMYESEVGLDGKKRNVMKLQGVAIVTDKVGINGRLYPRDVIKRESDSYIQNRILTGRNGAELNHPRVDKEGNGVDGSIFEINLKKVCSLIEKMQLVNNKLEISFRITRSLSGNLTTPGDILANLCDHGMKPGCSLRGAGNAVKHPEGYQIISPDYTLITVDIVGNPSFDSDAMLDVTYESAKSGGILLESVDNDTQKAIVEQATRDFLHSLDYSGMWANKREARKDLLIGYLNTITNI